MISRLADRVMDRRARQLMARLLPYLPRHGPLLDVGSGTGHNARQLREGLGLTVIEADVANLKREGPRPLPIDTGTLPLGDLAVPTALLSFVLSYAEQPEQLIRELHRVTGERLLLLQSICRGPRLRPLLALREFVEGDLAWVLGRLTGQVRTGRDSMRMRQVFVRAELIDLVEAQGWRLVHREAERGAQAWLGRDLFVFERA